jgi:tetratricopeptide (TPR) repeat protein
LTNFHLDGTTEPLAQFLQCTMDAFGGFSGSPIFLASGEVVALLNSSRRADPKNKNSRMITHGVRVDCLWELLAHHKLSRLVDVPLPNEKLLIARWLKPDPEAAKFDRLRKLVDDANYLVFTKHDCAAGIDKFNEAIEVYPRYAPAYRWRGAAFLQWRYLLGDELKQKQLVYLKNALRDADTNSQLHSAPTVTSTKLELDVLIALGNATNKLDYYEDVVEKADKILAIKNLTDWQRAEFLSSKAISLEALGKSEEARRIYFKVLQMFPNDPSFWIRIGQFLRSSDPKLSQSFLAMSDSLRKEKSLGTESKWKDKKVVSTVKESLTEKDPKDNRKCHQHVWTVELEAGYFYRVDLKNPTFASEKDYDPYLRVADDKNKVLYEDDDGGGYPNARIYFTARRTGNYTMIASSCYPGQPGAYVLTVTRIAKDQ